jgi:hypothetical protein
MNRSALTCTFLALALAACSQSEPPVPQFQTVTVNGDSGAQMATTEDAVPLPVRKATVLADAAGASREPAVFASVPSTQGMVSPTPVGPDGRAVVAAVAHSPARESADGSPVLAAETVASSGASASPKYASVTRYLKRWLPDFNKITECPNGITCQAAFTN